MNVSRETWRLILDPGLPGAHNMARDVELLEAVIAGEAPPTVRLYSWTPPCLSLGRHQEDTAADLDFCRRNGIDVVRRPTGGRAVLHDLELTYSVTAPLGRGPLPGKLQDSYRLICAVLVSALRSLGVPAELTGGEVNLVLPGPRTTVPCFEAPAGGEVVVRGRKLVGSAMRSTRGHILQHGSILLDWNGPLQAGALGLSDDTMLRLHVTTLTEQLGQAPSRRRVEDTFVEAVEETLHVRLEREI